MTASFYVAPEQLMKDRADFARSGISRGRSVVVLRYLDGICLVAENRSSTLHKISEIYDRIAFAAVGRYNEFENLRIAGIRHADLRGYAYDRRDVTARGLANAYAQLLGTIFSAGSEKPYEVELVVAEVGETPAADQLYRIAYDGSIVDETDIAVVGGSTERIASALAGGFRATMSQGEAVRLAVSALSGPVPLGVDALEVAVLDRTRAQARKFRRVDDDAIDALLKEPPGPSRRRRSKAPDLGSDATGSGVRAES